MATKLSSFVATAPTSTAASHYYVETADDGFIRPKSLSEVKAEIVTSAALGSGTANTSAFLRGDRTWSNNINGTLSVGGVPAYAWTTGSLIGAIDISTGGIYGSSTGVWLAQNSYWDGTNWIYKRSLPASAYQQNAGAHIWLTAPAGLTGGTVTLTEKLRIDADGDILQTNATSGLGAIVGEQTFALAANGTAFGPTIGDFFGASSSISLEAGSTYEINAYCVFLKTTAGTTTWTMTATSAPTRMFGVMFSTPAAGVGAAAALGAGAGLNMSSQAALTAVSGASTSLTTGVNHIFTVNMQIQTNLATNFKLQLTQSLGTATPLAGSYYKIKKISTTTGTFV